MAQPKLSTAMQAAILLATENGGKLERWPGGFWTYAGCPARVKGGDVVPDDSVTWGTIKALMDRGVVRVSRSSAPDGRGYVVEVEIAP